MFSVRSLSPEHLWEVLDLCPPPAILKDAWEPGDADRYHRGRHRRAAFLARKMGEGGRLQVAYQDGVPLGFIEYYPINVSNQELVAQDMFIIRCILVHNEHRGIGRALLEACLEDIRETDSAGAAVVCYATATCAFYRQAGFVETGRAGSGGVILVKPLASAADLETVHWVGRKPRIAPSPGLVAIDIYHTDCCPVYWRNTALIREVAREFEGMIMWREHWTDERRDMLHYGISYGAYVDGKPLAARQPQPVMREEVRQAIGRAIRDKRAYV